MSSLEVWVAVWAEHATRLMLVLTLAIVLVALLRRPCRRILGAIGAFRLWLLVPLMLLACELPHAREAISLELPAVVLKLSPATVPLAAHTVANAHLQWPLLACLLWIAGVLFLVTGLVVAQRRYQRCLRDAAPLKSPPSRWPIVCASKEHIGPALVGAWRPRVVLPANFDTCYEPAERALIIAHEIMHARRRDGALCLLAQLLRAVFWGHPLAWWAWTAFRHDQELACDAAVLREHAGARRDYATALLKTQATQGLLPVGCPWSPRHPVTERIAMLSLRSPRPLVRKIGGSALLALALTAAGIAYAAGSSTRLPSVSDASDRFTLTIDIATRGHPASMHFTQCARAGEPFDVSGSDGPDFSWDGRFAVRSAEKGQLEVSGKIHTRVHRDGRDVKDMSGQPVVRTLPGVKATIVFGEKVADGKLPDAGKLADGTVRIDLTPTRGCSGASLAASSVPGDISHHVKQVPAREAARQLAKQAGLELINPEALDDSLVSFDFQQMSAVSAMQLIADIDGKRAVFDDRKVRFETK